MSNYVYKQKALEIGNALEEYVCEREAVRLELEDLYLGIEINEEGDRAGFLVRKDKRFV